MVNDRNFMMQRKKFILFTSAAGLSLVMISSAVAAETIGRSGRTAQVNNVDVGQRQEAKDIVPSIDPKSRVENRIESRLQNRLRNRIDRTYDPSANPTSSYTRADQRQRKGGQRPSD